MESRGNYTFEKRFIKCSHFELRLYTHYPQHQYCYKRGLTQGSIDSCNSNRLQFHRDGSLLSSRSKDEQQNINLASLWADTALLTRLKQYSSVGGNFFWCLVPNPVAVPVLQT